MIKRIKSLFSPTGNPDVVAFLERLGRWEISEAYTEIDRYRDFRKVFSTPEGKRVLSQIMEMTHIYAPSVPEPEVLGGAPNPNLTYFREGERNVGLRIIATMNAEPE